MFAKLKNNFAMTKEQKRILERLNALERRIQKIVSCHDCGGESFEGIETENTQNIIFSGSGVEKSPLKADLSESLEEKLGNFANQNDARFHLHVNKNVLDNTTASFTTQLKTKLDSLENYIPQIADTQTLGVVKIGGGLQISSEGVVSVSDPINNLVEYNNITI